MARLAEAAPAARATPCARGVPTGPAVGDTNIEVVANVPLTRAEQAAIVAAMGQTLENREGAWTVTISQATTLTGQACPEAWSLEVRGAGSLVVTTVSASVDAVVERMRSIRPAER